MRQGPPLSRARQPAEGNEREGALAPDRAARYKGSGQNVCVSAATGTTGRLLHARTYCCDYRSAFRWPGQRVNSVRRGLGALGKPGRGHPGGTQLRQLGSEPDRLFRPRRRQRHVPSLVERRSLGRVGKPRRSHPGWTRMRELGPEPDRLLRPRHRHRHVPSLVGRRRVGWLGKPRRLHQGRHQLHDLVG